MGRIHIGIGGWTYEPWRGRFYPAGLPRARELAWAAARLSSIEVNGTFYRTQKPETFAAWRAAVPDGFVFALKAPRYATNRTSLSEAGEAVDRFMGSGITELGDALGPVNWQFGPGRRFDHDEMARFLAFLPKTAGGRPLRHALEVRHPSFADDRFLALAREQGVAIVLAGDAPWPRIEAPAPDFAYARIMGTSEGCAAGYADAALDAWADWARREAEERDVFLYVIGGFKAANPAAAEALIVRVTAPPPASGTRPRTSRRSR